MGILSGFVHSSGKTLAGFRPGHKQALRGYLFIPMILIMYAQLELAGLHNMVALVFICRFRYDLILFHWRAWPIRRKNINAASDFEGITHDRGFWNKKILRKQLGTDGPLGNTHRFFLLIEALLSADL